MSCCCCCFDAFFFLFLLSFLTSFMASTQKSKNLTCLYHDCHKTTTFDSTTTSSPASSLPVPGRGVNYTAIIVAISVPVGVVFLLYIIGSIAMRTKKGSDTTTPVIDGDDITAEDSLQTDFRTIQAATHDFAESNKLGESGFGEVYKGTLINGVDIVVNSYGNPQGPPSLNRDILGMIFNKLDVMDIIMGASRVCISWFLASHSRTLWNTVDLSKSKVQLKHAPEPLVWYKHLVNDGEESGVVLMNLVIEITKLSHTVPKNLFFNFYSDVDEDDLKFAAEKMPNIEKLFLPIWCDYTRESSRFAFSQWKNLTTLIVVYGKLDIGKFDFQAVGENCSNLINLKFVGYLHNTDAEEIVRFLQSLKRLSLQCSLVDVNGLSTLITGLKNLTILNLSHCTYVYLMIPSRDDFIQATSSKLEKITTSCDQDCKFCKFLRILWWPSFPEIWHNDEIKEFEF